MRLRLQAVVLVLVLVLGSPLATGEEDTSTIDGRTAVEWAGDLAAEEVDARRKAAFNLWKFGTRARPHVRALAGALRDDDAYVRSTVEKVLVRFEWQRSLNTLSTALPELIAALGDDRATVRLAAVNLIWNAGPQPNVQGGEPPPKTLLPALVKALGDTDAGVRANAAASLANLQKAGAPALPALVQALGDDDAKVRTWTLRALAWIDATKAMSAILKLAHDKDEKVRIAVCEAAGGAAAEQAGAAVTALEGLLHDESTLVRTAAVNGLWALARPAAVPTLITVLKADKHAGVRGTAAQALGGLGDLRAVEPLRAALASSDEALLVGAASGLSRLGPEGAIALPRMIEVLETGSESLKQSMALSISMLAPWAESALPALLAAVQHKSGNVRSMAASALASLALRGIRSTAMLATAIAGLADEAGQVRQYSLSVIAAHGAAAAAAVPALVALHAENDDQVGNSPIYSALQRIGPAAKEALPLLRKAAVATSGSDAMAAARSRSDAMAAAAALAVVAEEPKEIEGAVQVLIDSMADETLRLMALHHLKVVGPRAKRAAFIMRVWMMKPSFWQLNAAAALLRMEGAEASDAADVLAKALAGEQAGAAMRQLREVGPEGAALIPAVLAHAKDPASQWRAGGLIALVDMQARGEEIREVFAVARKDKTAWIRTLGARGLEALDKAKTPR